MRRRLSYCERCADPLARASGWYEARKRAPSLAPFGVALTSRGRVWNTIPKRERGGPHRPGVTRTTWRFSQCVGACLTASCRRHPRWRFGLVSTEADTPRSRVLVLRSPVVVGSGIPARSASEGVRIGRV